MDRLADVADTATWGLLVGLALPWLTAVVQQPNWTGAVRRVVAVAAAVVAGVLTCLADGTLIDAETTLQTVAAVLVASQASYATLTGPTAHTIEAKVLNLSPDRPATTRDVP